MGKTEPMVKVAAVAAAVKVVSPYGARSAAAVVAAVLAVSLVLVAGRVVAVVHR